MRIVNIIKEVFRPAKILFKSKGCSFHTYFSIDFFCRSLVTWNWEPTSMFTFSPKLHIDNVLWLKKFNIKFSVGIFFPCAQNSGFENCLSPEHYVFYCCVDPELAQKLMDLFCYNFHKTYTLDNNKCTKRGFEFFLISPLF